MPFLLDILNKEPGHNFTAVIFVQIGVTLTPNSALYRLVKTITRSQYVARVSICCCCIHIVIVVVVY